MTFFYFSATYLYILFFNFNFLVHSRRRRNLIFINWWGDVTKIVMKIIEAIPLKSSKTIKYLPMKIVRNKIANVDARLLPKNDETVDETRSKINHNIFPPFSSHHFNRCFGFPIIYARKSERYFSSVQRVNLISLMWEGGICGNNSIAAYLKFTQPGVISWRVNTWHKVEEKKVHNRRDCWRSILISFA